MKLGFVSAILPDLNLEETVHFAAAAGYSCIEACCWPRGKPDRRYAGVTHVDVAQFTKADADRVRGVLTAAGVEISCLCYSPNPLSPNPDEAQTAIDHLKEVIRAAELLDVGIVSSFIGRDWTRSVDENWPRFLAVWKPLVHYPRTPKNPRTPTRLMFGGVFVEPVHELRETALGVGEDEVVVVGEIGKTVNLDAVARAKFVNSSVERIPLRSRALANAATQNSSCSFSRWSFWIAPS